MESTQPACSPPDSKAAEAWRQAEASLPSEQAALVECSAALETLAGDLADQRQHVAEQCQRLALAQARWQEECETTRQRQLAVEAQLRGQGEKIAQDAGNLRRRQEEADKARMYLQALQARLTAQMAAWEGERQRWTAHLRGREELVERLLTIIAELHARWRERHKKELEQLRLRGEDFEETLRDLATQRDLWFDRCEELEREQRTLLRRLLSLDNIESDPDEKSEGGLEKKLYLKWGPRLAALSTTLSRTLVQERRQLQIEAAKLERRLAELQQQEDHLAARETELAGREIALEHSRALAESEHARLCQQLQDWNSQKDSYARQLAERKEEVERLAALLLEEGDLTALPVAKAA